MPYDETITTKIDYDVKVGKQRLDTLTKTIKKVDRETGQVTKSVRRYNKATGKLLKKNTTVVTSNKKAARSYRTVGRSIDSVSSKSSKLGKRLGKFKGRAGTVAKVMLVVGAAAITAGVAISSMMIKSINKTSDSLFKIQPLFKTHRQALKDMRDESERTGVSAHTLAEAYVNLRRRGFSARMAGNITALGEDIGATQADPRATTRVINAIGQIKGKGKLSTEELNQLAEGGGLARGDLLNNILRARGKAVNATNIAGINKDLEQGKISADEGINALFVTYQKMFNMGRKEKGLKLFDRPGQMAEDIGKRTTRGNIKRLGTTFENLKDNLSMFAAPGLVAGIRGVVDGLKSFTGDSSNMSILKDIVTRIGNEFRDFGTVLIPQMTKSMGRFMHGLFGTNNELSEGSTFMERIANFMRDSSTDGFSLGEAVRRTADMFLSIVVSVAKITDMVYSILTHPVMQFLAKVAGGVIDGVGMTASMLSYAGKAASVQLTGTPSEKRDFFREDLSGKDNKPYGGGGGDEATLARLQAMAKARKEGRAPVNNVSVNVPSVTVNTTKEMSEEEVDAMIKRNFGSGVEDGIKKMQRAGWAESGF